MTVAKSTPQTYLELETELHEIISWFESETFDVDQAVEKYKRGHELVQQLEAYLGAAENTVTELKAKFNATTT